MSDFDERMKKLMQKRQDDMDEGKKYVKDYKGEWSLKPSYTSSEVKKVKGPKMDARRKELQAEAKAYALRKLARKKEKERE